MCGLRGATPRCALATRKPDRLSAPILRHGSGTLQEKTGAIWDRIGRVRAYRVCAPQGTRAVAYGKSPVKAMWSGPWQALPEGGCHAMFCHSQMASLPFTDQLPETTPALGPTITQGNDECIICRVGNRSLVRRPAPQTKATQTCRFNVPKKKEKDINTCFRLFHSAHPSIHSLLKQTQTPCIAPNKTLGNLRIVQGLRLHPLTCADTKVESVPRPPSADGHASLSFVAILESFLHVARLVFDFEPRLLPPF